MVLAISTHMLDDDDDDDDVLAYNMLVYNMLALVYGGIL